jgi:hypothetical protein
VRLAEGARAVAGDTVAVTEAIKVADAVTAEGVVAAASRWSTNVSRRSASGAKQALAMVRGVHSATGWLCASLLGTSEASAACHSSGEPRDSRMMCGSPCGLMLFSKYILLTVGSDESVGSGADPPS